jgi:hypothetical protein
MRRQRALSLTMGAALFVAPLIADQSQSTQAPAPAGGGVQSVVGGGAGQGAAQPVGRQGGGRGRQAGPARPAPRGTDGRAHFGGTTLTEKGLWLPTIGITAPVAPLETVPFQPWARALYDDRQTHELEPHTRCKASGVTRQFETPYGVEFVEFPELKSLFIFDVGGPHTYRTVHMDGRGHPKTLTPTYYGHSIGWWEGDTLVIDTTGFNEGFWLDRRGFPHTDQMHTIERYTRVDYNTVRYEATIDDPGAYTKPWTGGFNLRWEANTELFEYVCQQANYAHELMVGQASSVNRTTTAVP